ncbi:MAG: flagellar biosynthesis protein FliQ [Fimbriimonadaceae bacterium]|nr:flagellar biosynthesis protein FliQ [Fimbriimonadaceae bacterium]QYK54439.1 MAG: flagellar biosynthesis protein FliQ [Fimbriimonadaceae bacterium]
MDQSVVMELARQGIMVTLMVTMPILAVALFTGLIVSVFQAVTQIQEMTLTYLPKIIGAGLIVVFMGGWMLQTLVNFMHLCLNMATKVGG